MNPLHLAKPVSRFARTVGMVLGLFQILPSHAAEFIGTGRPRVPSSIPAQPGGGASVGTIPPYRTRFGRLRPIVAVVGENRGTETVDFMVPYGILSRAGVAEVVAVATRPGPIQMVPALKIESQVTLATFDARYPEGADYVIVPAVVHSDDSALLAWVTAQAAKGGTIVGICDGVFVLGNAGLLKARRAMGHWFTQKMREKKYPETHWLQNTRYVSDGAIVTTAGVTAAIPVSVALVEAIAGRKKAAAVAAELGVRDWSALHQSALFHPDRSRFALGLVGKLAFWSRKTVGLPVSDGVDDVSLALVADAYARTPRSQVRTVAPTGDQVRTRGGLMIVPDVRVGKSPVVDRMLPAFGPDPAVTEFDHALASIADFHGRATAAWIAAQMEYPQP